MLWDELFAAMGCDRDRALLESYVSSGARASELLGVTLEDIDWVVTIPVATLNKVTSRNNSN